MEDAKGLSDEPYKRLNDNKTALNASDQSSNSGTVVPQLYFEFIVQGILITCVCGLGLLANAICIIVMNRPALKKGRCASVSALLIAMAGVDVILLICR